MDTDTDGDEYDIEHNRFSSDGSDEEYMDTSSENSLGIHYNLHNTDNRYYHLLQKEEVKATPLHHIILPRVLPQAREFNVELIEKKIVKLMVNNFTKFDVNSEEWLRRNTYKLLMEFYDNSINCSSQIIRDQIKSIKPGETFAKYLSAQNCTILIYASRNEHSALAENFVVAIIPGNLPPNEIYKRNDDIIVINYPEHAYHIEKSEMLMSKEFSDQLYALANTSVNHKNVSWLQTLLLNSATFTTTEQTFPTTRKKFRDEVWGDNKHEYFQRSGLYMSMKAMLQHSFILELGDEIGKPLYKMVMLKFLVEASTPYKKRPVADFDLMSQLIAKLARRIEKLMKMNIAAQYTELYRWVINEAKETIKKIRGYIDADVKQLFSDDCCRTELEKLDQLNLSSDCFYEAYELEKYLSIGKNRIQSADADDANRLRTSYKRYFKNGLPDIKNTASLKCDLEQRIFWIDFERLILYENSIYINKLTSRKLYEWSFAYANYAEKEYEKNPLSISRMVLVRIKLIVMLEKKAIREYPELQRHKVGIEHSIINSLLLPQAADMCIAFELENYIRTRNQLAFDPSLIANDMISDHSFSVKFAQKNQTMNECLNKILTDNEAELEAKKNEWIEKTKKAEKLKHQANRFLCSCNANSSGRRARKNLNEKMRKCERCQLINKANNIKIKQYSRKLPLDENQQFAIIFELNIPESIASLRDVLCHFAQFCHADGEKISFEWCEQLEAYDKCTVKSNIVKLGSIKHYKVKHFPVKNGDENLIIDNISDCIYYQYKNKSDCFKHLTMPSNVEDLHDKKLCTFLIEQQDEYFGLQWTLNSTKHTENAVLSSQSECTSNLTLSEYKNFGTIRADGHRLQILKLFDRIAGEKLSFEKDSVLVLVMQTLWECEASKETSYIREAHRDLADVNICDKMINLLTKFFEKNKMNWKHCLKLLTTTLIAVRAFEMNVDSKLATKIALLLSKIRSVCLDWMQNIDKNIRDMKNLEPNTIQQLRLKLIYVAIIGGLTFFVHPNHKNYENIFINNTDGGNDVSAIRTWLKLIIILKNNVDLYMGDEQKIPSNLRTFLQLMERVGISMEQRIKSNTVHHEIFSLICEKWSPAEHCMIIDLHFDETYPHILVVNTSTKSTVTIDIITSSFLVDNLPLSLLPNEIINSTCYRWFFGNVLFEVQPDSQSCFSTSQKYNGCSYEFRLNDDLLFVTERKDNIEKELIDKSVFQKDFPYALVNNYTHWLNKTENSIEFRRRSNENEHFSKQTSVDYRLNLDTHHLINVQTQNKMLDIKSKSYEKIINQLSRLESAKHIHVFVVDENLIMIELTRMNLKFKCSVTSLTNQSIDLISNEFNGMRVSRQQKIGTLYGLQHGLILEAIIQNGQSTRKILLLPNGNVLIDKMRIHTEVKLKNPPFYQYEVDTFGRQLKSTNGSHASWFYLAYLHAITSLGEVDPFMGVSGTERAIQILQSGYSWSSQPYDDEALLVLNNIANLTPTWKLHVNGVQQVIWPDQTFPNCSQDCFVFIVNKLLDDSQRLSPLYGRNHERKIKLKTKYTLNKRDHQRCQQLNPNLNVSNVFMKQDEVKTSHPIRKPGRICEATRIVSNLYHLRCFHVPNSLNLKQFLLNGTKLTGRRNIEWLNDVFDHFNNEEFHDLWMSLYDAALNRNINLERFTVILSSYAQLGLEIEPILALQVVFMKPDSFRDIILPHDEIFHHFFGSHEQEVISGILWRNYKDQIEENMDKWQEENGAWNEDKLYEIINNTRKEITNSWPCDSIDFCDISNNILPFEFIDFTRAKHEINEQLKTWHSANQRLNHFISQVEDRIKELSQYSVAIALSPFSYTATITKNWTRFAIKFDEKVRENKKNFKALIDEAKDVWEMKTESILTSQMWLEMYKKLCNTEQNQHLIQGGISPRLVPSLLLPKLTSAEFDDDLKCVIGAYGMAIAKEQRQNRMQLFTQQRLDAALKREQENPPYINWKPHEYTEWLLFEIEQNLTIRRIQIEIAKRMMTNPQELNDIVKHFVMQLNMGEGKTAVIVPILAAILANGIQCCQIIVLKSLFATNLKALRQYMGGFLNRRIYVFPSRRDLPIASCIDQILNIHEECLKMKGIILTIPEYRLSFQLKIYELISIEQQKYRNRNFKNAEKALEVLNWIYANVRTISDEVDAIFRTNNALVYPVGSQMQPDGASLRWLVPQAVPE